MKNIFYFITYMKYMTLYMTAGTTLFYVYFMTESYMTAGTALFYVSSWGRIPGNSTADWNQVSVYWQNIDEGHLRDLYKTFADLLVSK